MGSTTTNTLRLIVFITSALISIGILSFSFIQLYRDVPGSDIYSGLIGTILALYLPSPMSLVNTGSETNLSDVEAEGLAKPEADVEL